MTQRKDAKDKYPRVNVTYRPDQREKVELLKKNKRLSEKFQEALDDS
jgi:hypothetical protein